MTEQITTPEALRLIRQALETNGSAPPSPRPTHLDLKGPTGPSRVTSMTGVFQPRELEGRKLEGERHIETLMAAIGSPSNPTYLDPLVVWWGGDRWYVIDGHHRRHAYLRSGVHTAVPVKVFEGTLEEALAFAVEANSKDHLPMTLVEKLDRAWFLTVTTDLSRERIRRSCSVADGTVKNMRKVREGLLGAGANQEHLMSLTWQDARDELQGCAPKAPVPDWRSKMVSDYERRLRKTFGSQLFKNADILAEALVVLDKRFPAWLLEAPAFSEHVAANLDRMIEERDNPDY
ncbi:ParB N-terminal domain-containing protein [Mesorhizobium sp. WSM4887]|uniref:ParB/RepB/Spo0J family partition protein n=1 Tax=Mesorhizobium sp. WSM4887 TaxID=3038543 RepID=UPI002417CFF3|nr:ParB N-terminal domain-containing protein [Mesorhizobium sp. WSM4887]MDG4885845.1 ParB N-terminal domain-containing protein [Mesorhizobium sp. WSM4887]